MRTNAATWIGVILLAIALVLIFILVLNLLPWILLALGLVVLAILVAGLLVAAFLLIVAAPYYFVTKRAHVSPESSTSLDQLKEP